ncbi:acylphosphatase [Alkalilimnicola ehrlichii]|uniref:acylphosphatase n=1 Tax=Alkalilimnicola ehrlichii TaxID=351052 RepID=UPI0015F268E9|nr:acylphosphatase [Alkalilimnicola ehrlichii]
MLKPAASSKGRGFVGSIKDEASFANGWRYTRRYASRSGILVERRFVGADYRLYVVDGSVVGVLKREPASVVGNGTASVEQLINENNARRRLNPHTAGRQIVVDNEVLANLSDAGFRLNDVLPEGVRLRLRKSANVSAGGDFIDVTDDVHPSYLSVASEIANALRPVQQFGLDLLTKDIRKPASQGYLVIECEGDPAVSNAHFPMQGIGRNVVGEIVRSYFPGVDKIAFPDGLVGATGIDYALMKPGGAGYEAAELAIDRVMTLRSPNRKRRALRSGGRQKVESGASEAASPNTDSAALSLLIEGKVIGVGYRRWAKARAEELGLSGWVRNRSDRKVEMVIAGTEEKLAEMQQLCRRGPAKARVEGVTEASYTGKVAAGFRRRKSKQVTEPEGVISSKSKPASEALPA